MAKLSHVSHCIHLLFMHIAGTSSKGGRQNNTLAYIPWIAIILEEGISKMLIRVSAQTFLFSPEELQSLSFNLAVAVY